jgi:hypothetical protein
MKFYGHANLQKNQIQNAALESSATFPESPVVGLLAFVNSIVYICVGAGALPVLVPLTNEITAYTHTQTEVSQTWSVVHNLNTTSVNIQVYDNLSRVVIPAEIETNDMNTATISFNTASAGRAVVVSGQFDGNRKPTYAYTHYQNSAATSWVITHNLGYNPIVRVFIGNQEVQPLTIVHNSTNQVTITFSSAQVGYVRLI